MTSGRPSFVPTSLSPYVPQSLRPSNRQWNKTPLSRYYTLRAARIQPSSPRCAAFDGAADALLGGHRAVGAGRLLAAGAPILGAWPAGAERGRSRHCAAATRGYDGAIPVAAGGDGADFERIARPAGGFDW